MDIYRALLEGLQAKGYELVSYGEYCRRKSKVESRKSKDKFVILRHDVDAKPENSLQTAQIEHSLGAKASYYFRTGESGCYKGSKLSLPESVRAIAALGHEIGYHYEDMSLCGGDFEKAYDHFQTWLEYFRQYYAVETICMHGAPTSKWDSKDLWQKYDYKALGIIGEPYFDTPFGEVFYLTDTGRCWDGYRYSVVYYALRGMKDCYTHAVETAYGQRKRTERERDIARRVARGELGIPGQERRRLAPEEADSSAEALDAATGKDDLE